MPRMLMYRNGKNKMDKQPIAMSITMAPKIPLPTPKNTILKTIAIKNKELAK